MEFFEKVNELAKAAADKTAEVVEDTRLKAQILNEWCTAISVHKANIEEKKEALKHTSAKDAEKADDVAEPEASDEPEEDPFE